MVFQLKLSDNLKRVIQLLLIYVWVSSLIQTDSYINVYILVAIVAGVAVFKYSAASCELNKTSFGVFLVCAFMLSAAVSVANYKLYADFGIFNWIFGVVAFIGGVVAFWNCMLMLYSFPKDKATAWCEIDDRFHAAAIFGVFFALSVIINLGYLFSSQYPAVGCNDAIVQLIQIRDGVYTNHHPYWHTMVIKLCLDFAYLLGKDINVGVAIYSVWQIILVGSCFAYAITTLYQAGFSRSIVLVAAAFFLLAPYNISYSATMWKDTPFGVITLLFLVAAYRVLYRVGKNQLMNYILLFLGALGFGLWRSNGWLALFAAFIVFIPFFFRSNKKFLIVIGIAILVSWGMKGPYLESIGVNQPDLVESLSIPVQQVARTICEDGNITEEEYEALDIIMDVDEVPNLYLDYLSDPIKNEIRRKNQPYFEDNAVEYLKIWINIGIRNPGSYIRGWIDQTKGYWNGGYLFWITTLGMPENSLGVKDYDLHNPVQYLYYRFVIDSQEVPCLYPLFSIGLYTWIMVMMFVCSALKKRKISLLCLPIIMMIGTLMVATPVAYEFRYAYGMFTAMPFLFPLVVMSDQQ